MKVLIKGGLCLALGWLAHEARAQDIVWRSAAPARAAATTVAPAVVQTSGIGLSRPTPLDGSAARSGFAPIVRGQAGDDQVVPRQLPKDTKDFVPPPPQLENTPPSPILEGFGVGVGDCGAPCGPLADCCCLPRPAHFWASAEYLMWWQRGMNVPPLVTASPAATLPPILGLPTTSVLYDGVPNQMRPGMRFTLGAWLPCFNNNLGVEVVYFMLGRQSNTAFFGSNGDPQLGRPIFDTSPTNFGPNAEVFAGALDSGSALIHSYSQLWGMEGNLRYKLCCGPRYWLDAIGGYRYLQLSEGIDIQETAVVNAAPNVTAIERESFHTQNQFNGFQLGLNGECRLWNRWFVNMTTKLAMGEMHQVIDINGSTTYLNALGPGSVVVQQGALLTGPTNIGRYTANRFAVVPEIGLKFGIDLNSHWRAFVGYDFLYLSSVVRPGDQIDPNVNDRFRPSPLGPGVGGGPRQPAVLYHTTGYWAQGFSFGLMCRY